MLDIHNLRKRASLIQNLRHFFLEQDFLEVDTPIRIPAPAPEIYIEPELSGDFFLQTSPELCMKRLLANGSEKIFQICKCFRKGERGNFHLPEFTMLEWYRINSDYNDLIKDCENLLSFLVESLSINNTAIQHLKKTSEKFTVDEAFEKYSPIGLEECLIKGSFEENLCLHIEPQLGLTSPTILYDYPAELGALAKLRKDNSAIAERFELYINGIEIANGFSELTDASDQRARFEKDSYIINSQGRKSPIPEKFLADLERMPEAAGIALGVDRLAMILWGASSINEVITFTPEEL